MTDSALERITRSLMRLGGPGSFCAYHREAGRGLCVEVDGVGRCTVPIERAQAEALIERATPSPFGYRDETRRDRSVRDSWEIPGERVHLDPKGWSLRFERGLREITEALGFPPKARLTPRLQKLLIYGPGQFFAPHRDTEKNPSMVGTLVVLLPGAYDGGEVVISHAGRTVTHDTAADAAAGRVGFLGFYADCIHETKPVHRGHRVALTFSLEMEGSHEVPRPSDENVDLRQSIAGYFDGDDGAQWLVVLLDHEYSPQSLGWGRLKNSDRTRVDALREVARARGCACFLAIADVHESYSIDDEGGGSERHGLPPGGYGSLAGLELSLAHWLDERGEPCTGTTRSADEGCVASTMDSHQRAAYERTYSPWTGNEGGHADQWYHQAALVLVPMNRPWYAGLSSAPPGVTRPAASTRATGVVRRRRKKGRTP